MHFRSAQLAFLRSRWVGLATLAGYVLCSGLFLAVPLLAHGDQYVGQGSDPTIFIWAFAWWPHAILHGENPFFSHAVWAPTGVNLTWSTTVPGLALLFAPLTLIFGPVAAYNVAVVLMPAVSAWTAFLLCRYLTRQVWPSLVGGYLFGFSSYELMHASGGQLHLISVALIPLLVLFVMQFLDGGLTGRGLVRRLGPLLALELLISTEVAVTLAIGLAVALVLCCLLVATRRDQISGLVRHLVSSCAWAALLTAPFLYFLLTGFRSTSYFRPDDYRAEVLNFVLPAGRTLVGGGSAPEIARHFPAYVTQPEAYLGLPALLIVGLFARRRLRRPAGRFVLVCLGLATVAAMGARLAVGGHRIVPLPWALVQPLPVFNNILTVRFVLYISLLLAVVVASWTATHRSGIGRVLLPTLAVIAIAPNPHSTWTTTYRVPAFFTDSSYRSCLDSGETVLPLPIGQGSAMLWQAESNFRFKMAGGYVGPYIPRSFRTPADVYYVTGGNHLEAKQSTFVRDFIAKEHVTSAVVAGDEVQFFAGALNRLATPQNVGGVVLYHFNDTPASCAGP